MLKKRSFVQICLTKLFSDKLVYKNIDFFSISLDYKGLICINKSHTLLFTQLLDKTQRINCFFYMYRLLDETSAFN